MICKTMCIMILSVLIVSCLSYGASNEDKIVNNGKGFIVYYSNVVIKYKDKSIRVPIYGGTSGSINDSDLKKLYGGIGVTNGENLIWNICIPVDKGNVKKTFIDILKFYKTTLFKDIDVDTPSVIGYEGESPAIIWYDFNYYGVPSSMMITVRMIEYRGYWDNSIYSEDGGYIYIRMNIGEVSPFKDEKDEAYSNWIKSLRKKYPR